ncbi:hypothetical protein [Blastococcus xanthinilyticus]|uniref:Uncharacterized protein n=1 Tax=Blastococcus xanthinilyticus TaxID=1564164 RepID=A0A5S5CXX1_9ACTN|nr:hypothetical protein [Blastococcus xanthinilyticus]TYP87209.1 hypothetical protein BD833_107149 [Blastococcus xanthinilyticus]
MADGPPATGVHPVVDGAFRALDRAGLTWVLLRGADELAHPAGDVDVLVQRDGLDRLDAALTGAGLRRMGVRGHGRHRFYFRWDAASGLWITLDVVTDVDFGRLQHLRTPLADGYLARRRRVDGLWRPDPGDEAWFLLLHVLLDKRRLAPSRRDGVRAAAGRARLPDPTAVFLAALLGGHWPRRALEVCARAQDAEFARLAAALIRRWTRRAPLGVGTAWLRTLTARGTDLPVPGSPPGLTVAVTGPGAAPVARALRARFPGPRRVVGARPGRAAAVRLHRRVGRLVVLPDARRRPVPGADVVLAVDGTRPVDDVVAEAMAAIWAQLAPGQR